MAIPLKPGEEIQTDTDTENRKILNSHVFGLRHQGDLPVFPFPTFPREKLANI